MAIERLRPVFAGQPFHSFWQQTPHQVCIAVSGPQGGVHGHHICALGQREGPPVHVSTVQSQGVQMILIAHPQETASWFPELLDLSQEDPIPLHVEGQPLLTQVVKGQSREAAEMMSRSLRESSFQVYELHWGRFVYFCRSKRWHAFRVRSHHFSTYMMHLFRDGLLPLTIVLHRTSVFPVLRHWEYDPAADRHIKLLIRAFQLECPVQ